MNKILKSDMYSLRLSVTVIVRSLFYNKFLLQSQKLLPSNEELKKKNFFIIRNIAFQPGHTCNSETLCGMNTWN